MTIEQIAAELKQLPDTALQNEAKNPSPSVPGYLLVAETNRRLSARKAADSAQNSGNKPTILQQLANSLTAPPIAPPPPGQDAPQLNPTVPDSQLHQQPTTSPSQQFARGGVMPWLPPIEHHAGGNEVLGADDYGDIGYDPTDIPPLDVPALNAAPLGTPYPGYQLKTGPTDLSNMHLSQEGLERLKRSEGNAQTIHTLYQDGPMTATGYGHQLTPQELAAYGGRKTSTDEEVNNYLNKDVGRFEQNVRDKVLVPLTGGQFDALVDAEYNTGYLPPSVLNPLNQGNYTGAGQALATYGTHKKGSQEEMPGLVTRAQQRSRTFLGDSPSPQAAAPQAPAPSVDAKPTEPVTWANTQPAVANDPSIPDPKPNNELPMWDDAARQWSGVSDQDAPLSQTGQPRGVLDDSHANLASESQRVEYLKAAGQGNTKAMTALGRWYENSSDPQTANYWYDRAAKAGDANHGPAASEAPYTGALEPPSADLAREPRLVRPGSAPSAAPRAGTPMWDERLPAGVSGNMPGAYSAAAATTPGTPAHESKFQKVMNVVNRLTPLTEYLGNVGAGMGHYGGTLGSGVGYANQVLNEQNKEKAAEALKSQEMQMGAVMSGAVPVGPDGKIHRPDAAAPPPAIINGVPMGTPQTMPGSGTFASNPQMTMMTGVGPAARPMDYSDIMTTAKMQDARLREQAATRNKFTQFASQGLLYRRNQQDGTIEPVLDQNGVQLPAPTTTQSRQDDFVKRWLTAKGKDPNNPDDLAGAYQAFKQSETIAKKQSVKDEYVDLFLKDNHLERTAANLGKAAGTYAASARPEKADLWYVPQPNGTYNVMEVKDGDKVPPGAIAKAGLNAMNTPTSVTRTRAETARSVTAMYPEVTQHIDDLAAELGPAEGRWHDWWTNKVGADDPRFKALTTHLMMWASAVGLTHFGGKLPERYYEELKEHFGTAQTPEDLKAAVAATEEWIQGYENNKTSFQRNVAPGASSGQPTTGASGQPANTPPQPKTWDKDGKPVIFVDGKPQHVVGGKWVPMEPVQ